MASAKHTDYESYPKDTFDNPPQGPTGVHRGSKPVAPRVALYVAVLVLAAALGVLAWGYFSGEMANIWGGRSTPSATVAQSAHASKTAETEQSTPDVSATPTDSASPSASPSDTPSESPSAEPSETPSEEPEEYQNVNVGSGISVINGTGVNGYANQKAVQLNNAGFTNVTASNPNGMALPAQSVVWYQNDADLATAQHVAQTLGIATVEQAPSIGTPIAVVLMG